MFELRCPKCGSTRIHYGYDQAPIYKRVLGWQNLLCNGCNLLFTAFAWPGAVKHHSRRKRRESRSVGESQVKAQEAITQAREVVKKTEAQAQATGGAARLDNDEVLADTIHLPGKDQEAITQASEVVKKVKAQAVGGSGRLDNDEALAFDAIHLPEKDAAPPTKPAAGGMVLIPDSVLFPDSEEGLDAPPPPAQLVSSNKRQAGNKAKITKANSSALGVATLEAAPTPVADPLPLTDAEKGLETTVGPATEALKVSRPKHKKSRRTVVQRKAGIIDYARFAVYYSGLFLKHKIGVRKTNHSIELKFRWRNWWHQERSRAI